MANVIVMVKNDTLSEFYSKHKTMASQKQNSNFKEQEISLIINLKSDGTKIMAKINCPINPLPVKGWFEVPSINTLVSFLTKLGWRKSFQATACSNHLEYIKKEL